MSWDGYITSLVDHVNVASAAIHGLDNGAKWASSAETNLSAQQATTIAKGTTDVSAVSNGVFIGPTKYMFLRNEDIGGIPCVLFKKGSAAGGIAAKTGQCLLLGTYGEGMQAGNCNKAVLKMAEYLKGVGY